MKLKYFLPVALSLSIFAMLGCATSNAVKGGAIGTAAGGVVGGVIGHQYDNTALGAIIGAVVGGTAGVLIGKNMDKQAEEMRKEVENAEIERVGEGIKVTFDSGILFEFDSAELQPEAKKNIRSMADVLRKYPNSDILIEGDTDNTGSDDYNQRLSERRARAVADYQQSLGVSGSRIKTIGLGESNPVASNDDEDGRRQNRRVEIAVYANDDLKRSAEKGTLN